MVSFQKLTTKLQPLNPTNKVGGLVGIDYSSIVELSFMSNDLTAQLPLNPSAGNRNSKRYPRLQMFRRFYYMRRLYSAKIYAPGSW